MLQTSVGWFGPLTLTAAVALAQTETAQIAGSVKDQSRAVIPNGKMTAEAVDTGFVRKATTSNGGVHAIANLPPGRYRISVEAERLGCAATRGFACRCTGGVRFHLADRSRQYGGRGDGENIGDGEYGNADTMD